MSLTSAPPTRARTLSPGELAWIALLPCAVVIVAAIVVLGAPIGHAFLDAGPDDVLWPTGVSYVFGGPEPVKHARFAIALLGPLLLATIVLTSSRRPIALWPRAIRASVATSQALTLAFLSAAVLGQIGLLLPLEREFELAVGRWPTHPRVLVGVVVLAPLLLAAMRTPGIARRVAGWVPDTRPRAIACVAVAALLTACWLLTAINTEGSIGKAAFSDLPPWEMADALAILDGRTPLVDFYGLYGEVWAYVVAVPMRLFGASITVFSIVMTSISGLSLLAVYGIFRRIVRSSLLALLLYLPVVATSFLVLPSLPERPPNNAQIFSVWPMRYAGPYLLAWLTARYIDTAAPRRRWPLFLVCGLVLVNNVEFGIGAVAGTGVALLCAQPPRAWREAAMLVRGAAGGLLGALLLVSLVTFARSGALPHFDFLLEYPRLFGTAGAFGLPMRTAGFHLVLYATFAAAIAVAAVRVARRERDVLLTGMLMWSGTFGLLSGSYFAGRSDLLKLLALFSAWGFALALLLIVAVRELAARGWRRPRLAELLVLAGFGMAVGALQELPTPWSQLTRVGDTSRTPLFAQAAATAFVRERTTAHEHVAILLPMGHRIAYDLHLTNVAPYAFIEAMITERQMHTLIDAVRREGAHAIFVPEDRFVAPQGRVLAAAGFSQRAHRAGVAEWSDAAATRR